MQVQTVWRRRRFVTGDQPVYSHHLNEPRAKFEEMWGPWSPAFIDFIDGFVDHPSQSFSVPLTPVFSEGRLVAYINADITRLDDFGYHVRTTILPSFVKDCTPIQWTILKLLIHSPSNREIAQHLGRRGHGNVDEDRWRIARKVTRYRRDLPRELERLSDLTQTTQRDLPRFSLTWRFDESERQFCRNLPYQPVDQLVPIDVDTTVLPFPMPPLSRGATIDA